MIVVLGMDKEEQIVPVIITSTINKKNYDSEEQVVADIPIEEIIQDDQKPGFIENIKTIENPVKTDLKFVTETCDSDKTELITIDKQDLEPIKTTSDELKDDPSANPSDEYHYIKTGEFTSELFKVVVHNIPAMIRYGRFRETVRKLLGFFPKKIKYNPNTDYAFLACSNEEERQLAISILNGYAWKNNILVCKPAAPAKDPFVESNNKRRRNEKQEGRDSKKAKLDEDDSIPPEQRIVNVVCPYAKYSYEEQTKMKNDAMAAVILNYTRLVKNESLQKCWTNKDGNEVCLDLLPLIESPILTHYRNKVEFTIGKGPGDKDNTIGFRLGSYKVGSMLIVEATHCINCSKEAISIAKDFQQFIQALPHPSFNIGTHFGLWQQLIVRTCTTGEIMVIIQISKSHLSKEDFDALREKINEFYTSKDKTINATAVYFSWSSKNNSNIDTFEPICGSKHINEKLLDCKFRISPDAFFQVNTVAAEVLYNKVHEWCNVNQMKDACILDVCCGTGTIGICIASKTSLPVFGIEISEQAIEDANHNAQINKIENAQFFCGPAERILHNEIRKIKYKNIVAVVDPPRAGLHRSVINTLRSCAAIKKIIYVSCSPKQATDNFLSFCRPRSKRRPGQPFETTRAVPVDLFPQTPHCELIVELTRTSGDNKKDIVNNSSESAVNHAAVINDTMKDEDVTVIKNEANCELVDNIKDEAE